MRAFVALEVPEPQRALLASYLEGCRTAAPEFRWVPAESLHLTLRFLGHLEPALLESVRSGLRGVLGAPFGVSLDGLGTFGGKRTVRVVWMGIEEGVAAATTLAQKVEAVCQAAGVPAEQRPFRSHVTLARARSERGSPLPSLPPPPGLQPWTATRFTLYESRLGRPNSTYIPLERYPLDP